MPKRRSSSTTAPDAEREESGFYEAYAGFARALRVWFIAYGIGGPAVFLTNEAAGKKLFASGQGAVVAYAFLGGVTVQIALALLFKSAMWYLYIGEFNAQSKASALYKASDWLSESYWVEFVGDLATLVLFGLATLGVLKIFAA
jgi:hypothetical protein